MQESTLLRCQNTRSLAVVLLLFFRGPSKGQVWTRHSSCACLRMAFIAFSVLCVFNIAIVRWLGLRGSMVGTSG